MVATHEWPNTVFRSWDHHVAKILKFVIMPHAKKRSLNILLTFLQQCTAKVLGQHIYHSDDFLGSMAVSFLLQLFHDNQSHLNAPSTALKHPDGCQPRRVTSLSPLFHSDCKFSFDSQLSLALDHRASMSGSSNSKSRNSFWSSEWCPFSAVCG